jgi:hypothetical protein
MHHAYEDMPVYFLVKRLVIDSVILHNENNCDCEWIQ